MYINTFRYTSEDVNCRYCTEYDKKRGCLSPICPYLIERMEAGTVGYEEAVAKIVPTGSGLASRVNLIARIFPGTMWRDAQHKRRMEMVHTMLGYRRKRDTPLFLAALYILTSNEDICARTQGCFDHSGIDFRYARRHGIRENDYTLLMTAKSLYCGTPEVTQFDLADTYIIDNDTFRLILNTLLIARFGIDALNITKKHRAAWKR